MRILCSTLASPGFSFPVRAIAERLRDAGHELTGVRGPAFRVGTWHTREAVREQLAALDRACSERPPEVLLTSALCLGPLLTGARLGLPVAVVGLAAPLLPEAGRRRDELEAAWRVCAIEAGQPDLPVEALLGDLHLTRSVPELSHAEHVVGSCRWDPPIPEAVHRWLAASSQPVVYAQPGRTFGGQGFWPALGRALPPGVRLALSSSRLDATLGDLPGDTLAGPTVPHHAVLPHAAAVVCSGTTATVLGALEHGVPLVLVPSGGEHHALAELLEPRGLACVVPAREASPERLRAALDDAIALPAPPRERIARAFGALDGPGRAVRWIEQLR